MSVITMFSFSGYSFLRSHHIHSARGFPGFVLSLLVFLLTVCFYVRAAAGEPVELSGSVALPPDCQGRTTSPIRERVPVYRDADSSSEVVAYLKLGARVCMVGEQGEFAILQWTGEGDSRLRFIKKNDLKYDAPRRSPDQSSFLDRVRSIYNSIASGVVPEDPLAPYGGWTNPWQSGCEMNSACPDNITPTPATSPSPR